MSDEAGPGNWRIILWEDKTFTAEWSTFKDGSWSWTSWRSNNYRRYNPKRVIKYAKKYARSELRKYQRAHFIKYYDKGTVE